MSGLALPAGAAVRRRGVAARFLAMPSGRFSAAVLALLVAGAALAPWLAAHAPNEQLRSALLQPPAWLSGTLSLPLGTDDVGRDLWSRVLAGARLSLLAGALVVLLAMSIGTCIGLLVGLLGGVLDFVVMRVVDVMLAVPMLLLGIAIVAALGPSMRSSIIAVAVIQLLPFTRLTRALVRRELGKDYVAAARLVGETARRVMFRTILPNCLAPLIVQAALAFSGAVLEMAALGFLGMGAQPPTAEWGSMLSEALPYFQSAWWVVTVPGLAIFVTVLTLNLAGDALRDALDPRLGEHG